MIWFKRLFFLLVALAILQVIYYYPQVPNTVASHFDGLGSPNAWSSKNGFFGLYLAMILLLVIVFIFAPAWSESRIRFGMKIPNRDYWLAPERLQQTKEFFRRQMIIMGVVHLLLAIYTIQLAILANLSQQLRLHSSIAWALGLYFTFIIGWLIHFYMHFRKP
jgi:uncharacterized membrane protein